MARPLRIHTPGGYHHVTARGNDRLPIFIDDEDRWSFLRLLADANDRFGSELHAYCLMTNHVHLVVEDHQANLSKVLRHVKGVHAQRFNRRHDRAGHLFEGRFWSSLLGDDAYLTTAVEYVHRNPVDAGLASSPADYPWSSYPTYIGATERASCLTVGRILEMHGGRRALRQRTEGASTSSRVLDEFHQDRRPPVLGTEAFRLTTIAAADRNRETQASARQGLRSPQRPALASIRDAVAGEWCVPARSVSVSRQGSKNTARAVAIHLAQGAGWQLSEVADFFGLSSSSAVSAACGRLARRREREPDLDARVRAVELVLDGT